MKKFDKDKYLKKLKLKRNWQSYSRCFYIGIPCVLCLVLVLYFAYSKFFISKENEVVKVTVAPFIQGDIVISAYIDGEYSSTIPGKNDGYIVEKVVCDNDAFSTWDEDKWGLFVANLSKRTKCNVYFNKNYLAPIIAQLDTTSKCPTVNEDGSINVTDTESTDGYLCKAKDNYGDSYYYHGNVKNNYLRFGKWLSDIYYGYNNLNHDGFYQEYTSLENCQNAASFNNNCTKIRSAGDDMYWRIIRVNGDNSIRVIYDGTSAHANGEESSNRQIGASSFNSASNDNAYVGYMYGRIGTASYAETHANINDSIIKTYLDNWYKNNILNTSIEQYIVDNIFCNDRSLTSGNGAWQNDTYYRGASLYSSTKNVTLNCRQSNDAFTVNDTTNGNGALTYAIGLITADEVILAKDNDASNNYLNSGYDFWTMTPSNYDYDINISYILYGIDINIRNSGWQASLMKDSVGVRPVLNLKAEALKYGDGTASNPYRLTESLDNSSSGESGGQYGIGD